METNVKRIEVRISDELAKTIYVVGVLDEIITLGGNYRRSFAFGAYESEEMALAVSKAIKEGLINNYGN